MIDTQVLHCGYDLAELKSGFEGLKLGNGKVVKGTREAAIVELSETFGKLRGAAGDPIRENIRKVKEVWRQSWTEGGSRQSMLALSRYFVE